MMAMWTRSLLTVAMAAGLLLAGCAGDPQPAGDTAGREVRAPADVPSAPITNTDPCAMRLHDASGGLLLYVRLYGRLPTTLEDLSELPEGILELPPMACPVSEQPYVYRPRGIHLAERDEHVVLHDPAPSHSGMRWAVTFTEPADGGAPVTKVIALPESFFLLHPPG